MAPSHPFVTTSFLLANLHCPTCVSTIKNVLQESPGIRSVSPDVVTSWVTVEHDAHASLSRMVYELNMAGFQVSSITSNGDDEGLANLLPGDTVDVDDDSQVTSPKSVGQLGITFQNFSALPGRITHTQASVETSEQEKAHLNNCEQCRTKGLGLDGSPASPPSPSSRSLLIRGPHDQIPTNGAVMPSKSNAPDEYEGPTSSISSQSWRASLAVAGMTCAACVNTIAEELNKKEWITKVTVNLISNSATVEFTGEKTKADQIVEAVKDLGYDANLDQVLATGEDAGPDKHERTVEIRIDGMYCEHCGDRVLQSLAGFRGNLKVVTRPTEQRPIVTITYTPEVPSFTIRRILAAIQASDPEFKASIHHPPTLEERSKRIHAQHQKQIFVRMIFTLIAAIPTFVIGIVYMSLLPATNSGKEFLMKPWTSGINRAQMALFIMATPIYFFTADIFHRRAIKELMSLWRRGSRTPILKRFYRFGSMNMLISLGTTIAYVSSISQMIAAAIDSSHTPDDANFYFDSVVFLTLFLLVGRLVEAYSKSKTGYAVEALGKLRPATAILVEDDANEKQIDAVVDTDLLEFGDTVRVPHGASPPCDGMVIQGETTFDESSLTGESRPIKKRMGDEVYSGTVNKDAPILVRITGVAGKSMLDQIVNVVREGQTKRAPVEKFADMLTAYFVPVITLIAFITWIVWLSVGLSGRIPSHYLETSSGGWVAFSLQFAIAVFVVACPCGLALAAPTAIFVGGGLAAEHGILVKGGGEAFEKASRVDCVVFDKTGTLTMGGEPSITDAEIFPGQEVSQEQRDTLLGALRAVEENSSHPIAKAVVSFCHSKSSAHVVVEDVEELPGKGLKATCQNGSPDQSFDIIVGNEVLMRDFAVALSPSVSSALQTWKTEAKSVVLVATKLSSPSTTPAFYTIVAAFSISDPVRPETPAVIRALRSKRIDVWMLSGDNAITARAVALRIGIPESNVIAEVLPAQKYEKITYLQSTLKARHGDNAEDTSRRARIAMVGDGINDAPALSTADVGVAMGSGSDVAISSADFVLVNSNLASVVTLLDLSRFVFLRIMTNFVWALVYNVIAVPVAAGCAYPARIHGEHVRLDPVWASLAMALSSVSVVLSSLALRSRLPWLGFRARTVAA
ncbi:heavy metal translocatin [Biscogniauxia sp. FL1348]|nr:heavy metal translocatin [Biscogniauxia sp. FL1348]